MEDSEITTEIVTNQVKKIKIGQLPEKMKSMVTDSNTLPVC